MAFIAGISGNPNGRPKGSKNRKTLFEELVLSRETDLVNTAVSLALNGNEAMLRLLLDRLLPAKPKDDPIPEIGQLTGTLSEQGQKILGLVGDGVLTPNQGSELIKAIAAQANLVISDDLTKRIEKLEKDCGK